MVYEASSEVRNSIVFSTILVVLVFVPLFALSGMEGRLFTPLGVAYIVSILASLVVSLTVTPVLSYWLLPQAKVMAARDRTASCCGGSSGCWVSPSASASAIPGRSWATVTAAVVVSLRGGLAAGPRFPAAVQRRHRADQRGAAAGRLAGNLEPDRRQWSKSGSRTIRGVVAFGRRTGRAELDEHAEGVNMSEIIVSFDPNSGRSREEILADMREELTQVPGAVIAAEQPLQHVIAQMLSGVKAQIGIKLYGDDLTCCGPRPNEIKAAIQDVPRREGPDGRAADRNPAIADQPGPQGAGLLRAELGRRERAGRDGHERPGGLGDRAGPAEVRPAGAAGRPVPQRPAGAAADDAGSCRAAARFR